MPDYSLQKIARSFTRLGWIGLWVQAALAILPLAMIFYVVLGKATGRRETLTFVDYLAIVGLLILGFTALWSYYYTRVGRKLASPDTRPSWTSVVKTLWVGLWAGCAGVFVSMLLLIIEVTRLLVLLLKAPQGGVPVMRTEFDSRTLWISAIDIVTLLAELCTLVGELLIIGFTLWLLFQVTRASGYLGQANTAD
jgi:hypothetical protein